MLVKKPAIPTNLIMGFLGAGKTTAIINLLQQKPADENWAVLVNEFGQVGIDGAIYASQNAIVRELPGGCLCCTLGLPFQVTVNRMIGEIKPDRLIIEPTGLGHPKKLLDTLTGGYFRQVLDVRASICLLDPRKLKDSRYTGNANFLDQIALSDVLVANKIDLADPESISIFNRWVKDSHPVKTVSAQTRRGRLSIDWLDLPRNSARTALFPEAHGSTPTLLSLTGNSKHTEAPKPVQVDEDYRSAGSVYPVTSRFDYARLYDALSRHKIRRVKAVVATDRGWFIFNAVDGLLDCMQIQAQQDNRIEILDAQKNLDAILADIDHCLL